MMTCRNVVRFAESALQLEGRVPRAFESDVEVLGTSRVGDQEREGNRCRTASPKFFRRVYSRLYDPLASEGVIGNVDAGLFERPVEQPVHERLALALLSGRHRAASGGSVGSVHGRGRFVAKRPANQHKDHRHRDNCEDNDAGSQFHAQRSMRKEDTECAVVVATFTRAVHRSVSSGVINSRRWRQQGLTEGSGGQARRLSDAHKGNRRTEAAGEVC